MDVYREAVSLITSSKAVIFFTNVQNMNRIVSYHTFRRLNSSPWIRLVDKSGSNYVPLYFRDGGLAKFTEALQQ